MERKPDRNTEQHGAAREEESIDVVRAQLDGLMDNVASGVAIYEAANDGADFVIVEFNRAAAKIEQVKRDQILGHSVLEVFPGIREFGLFDVLCRVWKTGKAEDHPVSVYKDDRITGWRRNHVCRLPNGRVMAVYDDVTHRKRSELATRMSEQCFRAIANYTYDWEVWVGPTGRVLWTNPAVDRVTGYTVKELIAMRDYPASVVYGEDRDRIVRAFRSALKGSSGNDIHFRIQRKDGSVRWVEMSWQPIYDESSNSLGHRESIRDITARKEAEQALEQAKLEKETILDSLTELVLYQDVDLRILWANRAACESVDRTREELIGQRCYELWAERDDPCEGCPVIKAIESGCPAEGERTTPDGRVWMIRAAPVRDGQGEIVGGAEIALDITPFRRTEEALRELRKICQESRDEEGTSPE